MKKAFLATVVLVALGLATHAIVSYRKYNVILITIDTLRPDYLSCYNSQADPTPNIDRIAENGVLFTNAFTLIPITMPSHASILTSRQPHELRLFNNGDRFRHSVPLLPELLERKGYTTAAFVSLGVLGRTFGLAQGFDVYEDNFDHTNGRYYKVASEVNDVALPWIERVKNNHFFAWIHYSDPHEPYVTVDAPPDTEVLVDGASYMKITLAKKEKHTVSFTAKPGETAIEFRALDNRRTKRGMPDESKRFIDPKVVLSSIEGIDLVYGTDWTDINLRNGQKVRYFEKSATTKVVNTNPSPVQIQLRFSGGVWEDRPAKIRANYSAEVQYTDKYIGILWDRLKELGLLNRTMIVVTADHGEGLKTHGILGHVDQLWNETMHIPLIVYYPGLGTRGTKSNALVNLLDVMPSVLDLLHVHNEKPMKGQSLKRYISKSPVDWIFSKPVQRDWTFACTLRPQAAHNAYAITNGKIKIIHSPTKKIPWEAYDLETDPIEKKNIARYDPGRFQTMSIPRGLLEGYRREIEPLHGRRNPAPGEEEKEILQNLGYVGGDTP